MKRVVVTGMGAITPLGNNITDYWTSLLNGISGAVPITKFDATKFKTKFACEVKGFNALDHFEKSDVKKYDLFTQYALVTVAEAVKMANLNFDQLNKNKIGVIWGCGNGGMTTYQQQVSEYASGDGTPRFNPFFVPKIIIDIAAGVISMKYGLRGVNYATVSACASSTNALIDAFNYIRWGKANMIITGGSEAPVVDATVGGFNAARALSTNNKNCQTASRPFDVSRDGFVLGEGGAAIILESYEHAAERGATILAEIIGGGVAADAYHLTGTHPEGEGAYLGMMDALEEAALQPSQIDYLNAHATSTPLGDTSEVIAIERVFGAGINMNISGTKSMTGHLLGGAGAIEAVAAIKATMEDKIPPTINTKDVDSNYKNKFDFTLEECVSRTVNYAMSNTFGFGGHIATVIFRKW